MDAHHGQMPITHRQASDGRGLQTNGRISGILLLVLICICMCNWLHIPGHVVPP